MDFRVLGPLSVEDERGVLALDGARVRALLAFLLLRANTAVSTADLLDELWGEDLPKSGATAVQNAVARLRKILGERVETTARRGRRAAGPLRRRERYGRRARAQGPAGRPAKGRFTDVRGLDHPRG